MCRRSEGIQREKEKEMVECIVASIHLTIIMSHYRIFQISPAAKIAYRSHASKMKKNEMNLFSFLLDFFSLLSGVHIVNSSVTNLLFLLPFFLRFSVFVINRLRCCQLKMNKKSSFQLSSACFCSFSLHLFSASCDLITNNGIVYHVHTTHTYIAIQCIQV